jgi:hypothetical protein
MCLSYRYLADENENAVPQLVLKWKYRKVILKFRTVNNIVIAPASTDVITKIGMLSPKWTTQSGIVTKLQEKKMLGLWNGNKKGKVLDGLCIPIKKCWAYDMEPPMLHFGFLHDAKAHWSFFYLCQGNVSGYCFFGNVQLCQRSFWGHNSGRVWIRLIFY